MEVLLSYQNMLFWAGLPEFFLEQHTKMGNICQTHNQKICKMASKYTKLASNITKWP
jgi:hypothetical protein